MKLMLRLVMFSGWLLLGTMGYRELGTRYGLKTLSILGYKTDAAK